MTDANDRVLFTNTPAQSEFILHIQAAGDFELYVNANKTDYMCFKLKVAIPTLGGKPLKLVDHFTYLGINISSTESDVSLPLRKMGNPTDRQIDRMKI